MAIEAPLRITYLITRAVHGGTQVHLLDLVRGLRDRHQLTVGCGEEGFLTERVRALGVPVVHVPELVREIEPRNDLRALLPVLRFLHRTAPDVVHMHNFKAGLVGRPAAAVLGVRSVFTAHGWNFARTLPRRRKLVAIPLEWMGARLCDRIITVCEADRQRALRFRVAPPEKIVTIHNGVQDGPLRAAPGEAADPVRVVMIARLMPQKDHATLLRAVQGLGGVRVQLVGDGPSRHEVEALAERLGVREQVEFLGMRDDVPEILARAHAFALTTHYEGFPLVILEAMRTGLPVVATDVDGDREAITEGVTGFLVPHEGVSEVRRALERLVGDPALRARMGASGRERYEREFTVDRMVARTEALYRELVPTA